MWTGDVSGAGTDANVFIQMYGEDGKTEEYKLRNRTDNFEKAQMDKFKVNNLMVLLKMFNHYCSLSLNLLIHGNILNNMDHMEWKVTIKIYYNLMDQDVQFIVQKGICKVD